MTAARQATAGAGCVVTMGSGTITDIGKAATRNGTPLVAVQTATSVNGYADSFSVLLHRGVKRTTPARWPDTLLIDAAILRAAPPDLNLARVGDLMAMFTATADWYLASAMTGHVPGTPAAHPGDPPAPGRHPPRRPARPRTRRPPRRPAVPPRRRGAGPGTRPAPARTGRHSVPTLPIRNSRGPVGLVRA